MPDFKFPENNTKIYTYKGVVALDLLYPDFKKGQKVYVQFYVKSKEVVLLTVRNLNTDVDCVFNTGFCSQEDVYSTFAPLNTNTAKELYE